MDQLHLHDLLCSTPQLFQVQNISISSKFNCLPTNFYLKQIQSIFYHREHVHPDAGEYQTYSNLKCLKHKLECPNFTVECWTNFQVRNCQVSILKRGYRNKNLIFRFLYATYLSFNWNFNIFVFKTTIMRGILH